MKGFMAGEREISIMKHIPAGGLSAEDVIPTWADGLFSMVRLMRGTVVSLVTRYLVSLGASLKCLHV